MMKPSGSPGLGLPPVTGPIGHAQASSPATNGLPSSSQWEANEHPHTVCHSNESPRFGTEIFPKLFLTSCYEAMDLQEQMVEGKASQKSCIYTYTVYIYINI